MGQYESINLSNENDLMFQNLYHKVDLFFKNYSNSYLKCGILVPRDFINQFNEKVQFSKNNLLKKLNDKLKSKYKLNIATFNELESLINFFKSD